jgi:hypothetical protein
MSFAYRRQKSQDWFTQQWAILWGKRVSPDEIPWLIGPFGDLTGVGFKFIDQLAEKEALFIERSSARRGLIASFDDLGLSEAELSALSPEIVDFYENTADYDLRIRLEWNSLFRVFGVVVKSLFSNRLDQLNIPTSDINDPECIAHKVITLFDPESKRTKYTVWLRTLASTGRTIYSGVYGTCTLPSGKVCIKAVFPLPNGNATVIMSPSVGTGGELKLESMGVKFGDPGFYFLLNDSKGNLWAQFVSSFRDRLTLMSGPGGIIAKQTLTLWHLKVLTFTYEIRKRAENFARTSTQQTAAKSRN